MKSTDSLLLAALENTSISSSHTVIAEFNMNSYFVPTYYGSYNTSSMPSTFTVGSGYTNGINQLLFGGVDSDDKKRKKLTPLYECFSPNRPNPGIIKPVTILGHSLPLVSDDQSIKQMSYANSETRLYPVSEKDIFKYWNSYRYKSGRPVGLSSSLRVITDSNPFVVYDNPFYTNKIVIKTQKETGYPTDFNVQILTGSSWNTWTTVLSATSSTAFSDGEIVLGYNGTTWSIISSEADQPLVTNFFDANTQAKEIKGIRFVVSKMSQAYCPLELIEISPRLVADVSDYVIGVSLEQSIGDSTMGLPIGSIVSSSGNLSLSNDDGAFDRINTASIFTYENDGIKSMLGQNVKITVFQNVVDSSEDTHQIKLGVLYTNTWDSGSDYTVEVSLEDYFKFFRETQAPNLLVGFKNPLKASIAIRMLLDNLGFNRFTFHTTLDESNNPIDPTMKFFYCSSSVTAAEALNDLAKSLQLSIFMDYNNNLRVYTKEKLMEKPDTKDYWFVSDKITGWDYEPNIESFKDNIIPPVTSANVIYKLVDIKREFTGALAYKDSDNFKELSEKLAADPASLLTKYAYVNDIIWQVSKENNESVLLYGIITKTIPAVSPLSAIGSITVTATNEKDAAIAVFDSLAASHSDKSQIFIDKSDATLFSQASKFTGYVYISNELIRYNGINYAISTPDTAYDKIIFSSSELESIKASLPSGSNFIPKSLVIYFEFKEVADGYTLIGDGRAQEGTTIKEHQASKTELGSSWTNFSNMIQDVGLDSIGGTKANALLSMKNNDSTRVTGILRLEGPSSLKSLSGAAKLTSSVANLPVSDYGQRYVHGVQTTLGFVPQMIGCRMKLLNTDADSTKDTSSHIAGIAFYLNDAGDNTTDSKHVDGYYLEVSDNIDAMGGGTGDDKTNNIRLYRMKAVNNGGVKTVETFVIGYGRVKLTPDSYVGFANVAPQDGVVSEFDLKVIVSSSPAPADSKTNKKVRFSVYWEGIKIFTAVDSSPLMFTKKIGTFVRDDSVALYDYIYACAKTDYNPVSEEDKELYNIKDLAGAIDRSIVTDNNDETWYFNNFGNAIREVAKISAKFSAPTISSEIIDISSINPAYLVKDYKPTSFGADFWVYNTSSSNIVLDESSNTPLYISGFALDYRADGQLSYEDLMSSDKESQKRKLLTKNKNLYGDNNITIETEYISSRTEAENLLKWILNNSNIEKRELSMGVFPNPLIEVGDKVGVSYPEIGYSVDNIGDKTYYVAAISRSVNESGPQMSIMLREC